MTGKEQSQCPPCRPKVLLLGISYPDVQGQMKKHRYNPDVLIYRNMSVEQAVECVRRGIMTEMDGRDGARCISTEEACNVDVYTVSMEIAGVYRQDRHLHGDFNARNFCQQLKDRFGDDLQFAQVILDYFWLPSGWLSAKLKSKFFQHMLPQLVELDLLAPSSINHGLSYRTGVVYLPFSPQIFRHLVAGHDILKESFEISFVSKDELDDHMLWVGTNTIDAILMQNWLGKQIDQEEIYCKIEYNEIKANLEDGLIPTRDVLKAVKRVPNLSDVRMVRLRALAKDEPQCNGGFTGMLVQEPDGSTNETDEPKKRQPRPRPRKLLRQLGGKGKLLRKFGGEVVEKRRKAKNTIKKPIAYYDVETPFQPCRNDYPSMPRSAYRKRNPTVVSILPAAGCFSKVIGLEEIPRVSGAPTPTKNHHYHHVPKDAALEVPTQLDVVLSQQTSLQYEQGFQIIEEYHKKLCIDEHLSKKDNSRDGVLAATGGSASSSVVEEPSVTTTAATLTATTVAA